MELLPPSIRATINRAYRANEPGIVTLSSVAQKKECSRGRDVPFDVARLSLPPSLFLSIIDAARRRHSRSKVIDRVLDATVTRRPPSSIARKGGRKANVREFHSRQETIIFLRQRGERRRIRFRIRKLFVIVEETQSVKLWKTKKFGRVKAAFIVRTMKESNLRLSLSPWRTNGHRCSNYRFERKRRPAQILLPRVLTVLSLSLSLRGEITRRATSEEEEDLCCVCVCCVRGRADRRGCGERRRGRKASRYVSLLETWRILG